MPVFECSRCHRRVKADYELSCTGNVKRNVEKAPECCGRPMAETPDD
ncbi:MAG: hypothetical protein ACE14S_11945 [Candidatus Bathyarchaeia archaeon]